MGRRCAQVGTSSCDLLHAVGAGTASALRDVIPVASVVVRGLRGPEGHRKQNQGAEDMEA
jgi:hypothetical protein